MKTPRFCYKNQSVNSVQKRGPKAAEITSST